MCSKCEAKLRKVFVLPCLSFRAMGILSESLLVKMSLSLVFLLSTHGSQIAFTAGWPSARPVERRLN